MIKESLQTGFPSGNLEQYASNLITRAPKIANLLFKTIDPLICGSLIELLGSSSQFKKTSGNISYLANNKAFRIQLVYTASEFVGYSGNIDPIIKDQEYILKRLQQIPSIRWTSNTVKIIPSNGTIVILFNIPAGI